MDRTGSFLPRVTRTLTGPAQIVHATPIKSGFPNQNGPEWCVKFNEHRGQPRQIAQYQPVPGTSVRHSPIVTLLNFSACRSKLAFPGREWPAEWAEASLRIGMEGREDRVEHFNGCPFSGGGMRRWRAPKDGGLLPTTLAEPVFT